MPDESTANQQFADDSAPSDSSLVAAARRGDPQAFQVLVYRHSRALFHAALQITNSTGDAEDMVQETFLRAFRQLNSFDGRSSFATWIHRICINCTLDWLRSRHGRSRGTSGKLEQLHHPSPSPERRTSDEEFRTLLRPALDTLSNSERSAFVLRYLEGEGIATIARHLAVEENTAKQTVFRAVRKIRKALRPLWGNTDT